MIAALPAEVLTYNTLSSAVYFASADTVAKVEGWPEPRQAVEERIRDLQKRLERAEAGVGSASGLRPDVEATRLRDLLQHEQDILDPGI